MRIRKWYGLDELWVLMLAPPPVSQEVRQYAQGILSELFGWTLCYPKRWEFLERCVAQLNHGEGVPQALRLCQRICASFPAPRAKGPGASKDASPGRKKGESLATVLDTLNAEHDLLPSLFSDFARYHDQACGRLAALSAAADAPGASSAAVAALSTARAEHMAQLGDRLDFLTFCTLHGALPISQAQVDVLWDCCVARASSAVEADTIFGWLETCRVRTAALDLETTRHLFVRASALPLEQLSLAGFSCVAFLFKWINWSEGTFAQHDASSFTVLALPLHGAQTLWEIAFRASDPQVGKRAVGLLTQLHHSLAFDLGPAQAQQRRVFVSSCMQSLAAAATELRALQSTASSPAADSEERALSLRIERCLTLLRLFVEEVEAKLPADDVGMRARRHGTVVRGNLMSVSVTLVGGANSPKLNVRIDSNQTVGSLRMRVWQELSEHGEWQPETPAQLRMITQGRELKEDWRTLAELKLREPYGIHVMRRSTTQQSTQPQPQRATEPPEGAASTPPATERGANVVGNDEERDAESSGRQTSAWHQLRQR